MKNNQQGDSKMATKKTDKPAPKTSLFAQADAAKPSAAKTSKGKMKKLVSWAAEFEVFTALVIFLNAIKGIKKQMEGEYKDAAFDLFFEEITQHGVKPESFEATSGCAASSFQYRKKAKFAEELAEKLRDYGVPFDTNVKVQEGYIINPDIINDDKLRNRMDKALQGVDFGGLQVFIKQDAVVSHSMNDATIPAVITNVKNPAERKIILRGIATLAIAQATLDGQKLSTLKDESKEGAAEQNELITQQNAGLVTKALQLLQNNGIVTLAAQKKALNKKVSEGRDEDEGDE